MSFYIYSELSIRLNRLKLSSFFPYIFLNFFALENYYLINEKLWQEGLFIDFLQKKFIDNWVKKFLVYSSYLFNERLVFEKIIRFYLDLIILPAHRLSIFEFHNVGGLLFMNLFIFFLTLVLFLLTYLVFCFLL